MDRPLSPMAEWATGSEERRNSGENFAVYEVEKPRQYDIDIFFRPHRRGFHRYSHAEIESHLHLRLLSGGSWCGVRRTLRGATCRHPGGRLDRSSIPTRHGWV